MNRWFVPAVPFALSLGLSLSTVGSHVFWQDSGFFLSVVKELGVLYPPGFVLYVLLCKVWTLVFFFLDFTLAVHLFSSFCTAAASAVLALAARDLLRSDGPIFRVAVEDRGPLVDWIGAAAGSLAASGYTFWFSGIYAKGYAFYYLILALLIWRMIRADCTRRPGEFTAVAALIGLAWQAHPSATLAGLSFLLFAGMHAKVLGPKAILWRVSLAAACAAGPAALLPLLSQRDTVLAFGQPAGLADLVGYLRGRRFTEQPDSFGLDAARWTSFCQYFWEEMLGVTVLLIALGLLRMVRTNRRLLLGLLSWTAPYIMVTTLFRREGQHDHWYVAAWMPLHLASALGLYALARPAGKWSRVAVAGLAVAGVTWSVGVNRPDLNQRGYDLPEIFGRIHLAPLDRNAILIVGSDDSSSICHYLQIVGGYRTDVLLVRMAHLGLGGHPDWYDHRLQARDSHVREADYAGLWRRFPRASHHQIATAAFANANVSSERAVYIEVPPPAEMIRPDYTLVPAGPLFKLEPRSAPKIDAKYWSFPIEPEEVRRRFRRSRGQRSEETSTGKIFRGEPYERRLFILLLRSRKLLADWHYDRGAWGASVPLYESILRADPEAAGLADVLVPLGTAYAAVGRHDGARALLEKTLNLDLSPLQRAGALVNLGEIARAQGRDAEAARYFQEALRVQGLDPSVRQEIERRVHPK